MRDVSLKLPSNRDELTAHVHEFERWFQQVQLRHGMNGAPLHAIEHNVLRAYITWLRDHAGGTHAPDQTD